MVLALTEGRATIAAESIAIITLLSNLRLYDAVSAELDTTDVTAAVTGECISIITLFLRIDCGVTAAFERADVTAAVAVAQVPVIALFAVISRKIAADAICMTHATEECTESDDENCKSECEELRMPFLKILYEY